jgi:UMF1 family MFS transporter
LRATARRLLGRIGLGSRPLFGWAMYDWANSAFFTLIVAAVYPVFFERYAAAGAARGVAMSRHAAASFLALAVVAVLSPLLGAAADSLGAKKRLLAVFLAIGALPTAGMALVGRGDWALASGLFVVANIGIVGSLVFYDSLLTHIAPRSELDRVSSAGYALGYLGGGVALLLALLVIADPGRFGIADTYVAMRWSFLGVGLWWLGFSLPLFRWVPEPPAAGAAVPLRELPAATLRRLSGTMHHLRRYRQALLLLVAVAVYSDGIGTIIRMAALYGAELGLSEGTLIGTVLAIQFVGVPCAFLFGWLGSRIGTKRALLVGLTIYCGISVYGYFVRTAVQFVGLGMMVALVQGGTQALSRSLFASFVPASRSAEFFGFFSVFEKFAGVLGPALVVGVVGMTGSSRNAILGVVVFFVVGGALLLRVDVREGQAAALEPADPPPEPPPPAAGAPAV